MDMVEVVQRYMDDNPDDPGVIEFREAIAELSRAMEA